MSHKSKGKLKRAVSKLKISLRFSPRGKAKDSSFSRPRSKVKRGKSRLNNGTGLKARRGVRKSIGLSVKSGLSSLKNSRSPKERSQRRKYLKKDSLLDDRYEDDLGLNRSSLEDLRDHNRTGFTQYVNNIGGEKTVHHSKMSSKTQFLDKSSSMLNQTNQTGTNTKFPSIRNFGDVIHEKT